MPVKTRPVEFLVAFGGDHQTWTTHVRDVPVNVEFREDLVQWAEEHLLGEPQFKYAGVAAVQVYRVGEEAR